jgi:SAM-dependent methyltransferase
MSPPSRLRRAALRRLGRTADAKGDAELHWWLTTWDPVLREGGLNPSDALELLGEPAPASDYAGRRWQQARAEVERVVREAALGDTGFFTGKVVVDIGPGPLGFPDACPARLSIGVDPLAERFADNGLLLESSALYLSVGAESIPLVSRSVDVVLARNSLDHVDDPPAVVAEARRLLRPGGTLALNFDVDHTPSVAEPHALDAGTVRRWLAPLEIIHEEEWEQPHGLDGHAVVLVACQR